MCILYIDIFCQCRCVGYVLFYDEFWEDLVIACVRIFYSICIEISYVGSSMCVSMCVCCGASGINITVVTHFCCCCSVAQLLLFSPSLALAHTPVAVAHC